jgi:hypothetical protein
MRSSARRAAATITSGLVALAGLALLLDAVRYGEAAALLLSAVVGIGALQMVAGLVHVMGDGPVERAVEDRPAWGAGWVLDGARAVGLAVAVWMLFAPGGDGLELAGGALLAAVILAQPFSAALDRRAVPTLRPGTYTVTRTEPRVVVLPPDRALAPVVPLRTARSFDDGRVLHRVDTRL